MDQNSNLQFPGNSTYGYKWKRVLKLEKGQAGWLAI